MLLIAGEQEEGELFKAYLKRRLIQSNIVCKSSIDTTWKNLSGYYLDNVHSYIKPSCSSQVNAVCWHKLPLDELLADHVLVLVH